MSKFVSNQCYVFTLQWGSTIITLFYCYYYVLAVHKEPLYYYAHYFSCICPLNNFVCHLFVYRCTLLPFAPHYPVVCIYMNPTLVSPSLFPIGETNTLLVITGLKELGMND